jgi:hypothetical protein
MRLASAALLVISLAAVGTAHSTLAEPAQHAPTRSPSQQAERGCALGSNAPTLGENNSTQSLSDRLAQSKGVICPPRDVDPHMTAPPPAEGNTPVIPPPGAPGGDPHVQPR